MADDGLRIINTVDNSQLEQGFRNARNVIRQSADAAVKEGDRIDATFDKIGKTAAAMVAGFEVKSFIQKVVQIRGEFQQLEVAFNTMLGSAEKANALMNQLVKTAASTPFDLKGVADGAKQLLAYGVAADEVNDTLIHLGDIAAGLSLPLGDLVYLYGTTMTQGRMYTRDMIQFMGRGIPLAEELAKQFGVSKDKVSELVTAGKVGAEEFKKAIMSMSSEGGKFGGLMEAQSKTITGQISNIEDSIDVMFNNIGKQSEGIINDTLSVVSSLVENYEKVGKVLISLVAVYGTYKAAMMTAIALQNLQALGVSALTTKEAIHYGWLVVTRKAQLLLNASMLTNPYVLMATAIAGVVAALVMMKSQQELVTEAENAYNEAKDEAIRKEEEHANKINELCRIAGDESLSTESRRLALVKLEQQYPAIFAKYDTEAEKLANILNIKREIAALDGQNSIKNPTNELYNVNKRINELEAKGAAKYQTTTTTTGAYFTTQVGGRSKNEEAELIALKKKREELSKTIKKNEADNYLTNLTGVSNDDLQAQINERRNLLAQMQANEKKYGRVQKGGATGVYTADELAGQIGILEAEQNKRKEKKYTPAEQKKALYKTLQDARKALADFDKSSTQYTVAEAEKKRKELQDAVSEAEKKYKAFGGSTSKSGKKTQNEREQAEKAYQLSLASFAKEREKLQEHLSQSLVDIEENTAARELAQLKHDHEVEMAEFEAQKQDYIQKKIELEQAKAKASGKTYTTPLKKDDVLSDDERKQFSDLKANLTTKHNNEMADYYKAATTAMNDYLKEYGTYQQKRLAITQEYEERIKKARTEGEKMTLRAEMSGKIADIDANRRAMNIDWSQTFSGVGNVLSDIARETLGEIKEYMKTEEFKKLSPEGKKAYTDLAGRLQQEGAGEATSPFNFKIWGTIAQNVKDYQDSVRNLKLVEDEHTQAVEELIEAQKKLEAATDDAAKAEAQRAVDEAQKKVDSTAKAQREAEDKTKKAQSDLKENTDKATQGLANFTNALNEMSNGSLYGFANGMTKLITSIGGASKGLSEIGGKAGGIVGAILQIIDALGDDPAQFIEDLLMKVATAIERILEDLPKIIGNVVSGVGNIVAGVVKGVAGIFGADLSGIFGGGTENFDAAVEKWGWLLDTWKENLEYERSLMKDAYGSKVTEIQKKTEADLRRTQQAAAELYRGWADDGAGWFSHSNGYEANRDANWRYLWEYDKELAKRMGASEYQMWGQTYIDNGDIKNLFNLSADELKDLKHNNSQFWQSLTETARQYLDQIIEVDEQIKAFEEQARQQLTNTTLDSVVSEFARALENMDSDSKTFAENFEDYMKSAVINSLMLSTYKKQLEEWYKNFAKAMESDGLDKDEQNALREEYDRIVKAAIGERDELKNMLGWEGGEYKQEASSKGFQAMSQDTGDELNGRFTAIQIAVYDIKELATQAGQSLLRLETNSNVLGVRVEAIQTAIATSNVHLSNISKYTKKMSEFGSILEEIRDNTNKL